MRLALGEAIEALRPSALNELGLFKAMDRGSIRQQAERAVLRFSLETRDASALTALDEAASVAAYRIVQEAVNNAVRHADATQVRVRLNLYWRRGEAWLVLAVEDDGKGFSPTAKPGNGLRNMRDRALMLGGGVRIGVRQQNGTRVRAWLRAQA
jgi:two-component system sensor histidine kinase UhpB